MSIFKFKHFFVIQKVSAMKVGTDAMILGAFVDTVNKKQALDIGTGTGVISLMLAQKNEALYVTGIEIDSESAVEAQLNFEESPWGNQLSIIQNNFLLNDFKGKQYDLIVSNPPYFSTTNENLDERKAKTRHVSSLQIIPFIEKVNKLLTTEGNFWVIIPFDDYKLWQNQFKVNSLYVNRKIDVIGKEGGNPIRCILNISRLFNQLKEETFCIRNSDGTYTEEYIQLTKEYHGVEL